MEANVGDMLYCSEAGTAAACMAPTLTPKYSAASKVFSIFDRDGNGVTRHGKVESPRILSLKTLLEKEAID